MHSDADNQSQIQSFRDLEAKNGSNINITQHLYSRNLVDDFRQRPLKLNSPYKGLESFGRNDSDVFFGRDQLINQLGAEIATKNLVVLLGRSGVGKSSVVCAGLIRALEQEHVLGKRFKAIIFRPDDDPFYNLRSSLISYEGGDFSQKETKFISSDKPDTWKQIIDALKQRSPGQWLIFIDQFEQIFTNCRDDNSKNKLTEKARNFIQGIAKFAAVSQDSVKLILAMRTEFLDRFSECLPRSLLARNLLHYCTYVEAMNDDELRLAIERPASQHGVEFEQDLVREILQDTQGQAGALPLLQYALNRLWEDEKQHLANTRMLRTAVYRGSGGVRGTLQKYVQEEIYEKEFKTEEEQKAVRQIFLSLVDIVDGIEVKRIANRSEFKGQVEDVLKRLEDTKLITIDRNSQQQVSTVELAHEYLIRSWNELRQWVDEAKEAIVLKNSLYRDSQIWVKAEKQNKVKAEEELWAGSKLERMIELRDDKFFELKLLRSLDPDEDNFINASVEKRDRQREERDRKRRNRLIASVASATVIPSFLYILVLQWSQTAQSEIRGLTALSASQLEDDQLNALVAAVKAGLHLRGLHTNLLFVPIKNETSVKAVAALQQAVDRTQEINRLESNIPVHGITVSPDGQFIASRGNEKTIRIWKKDGSFFEIKNLNAPVREVKFISSDTLVAVDNEGIVKLWKLNTEESETRRLQFKNKPGLMTVHLNSDGRYLATGYEDGTIQVWDTNSTKLLDTRLSDKSSEHRNRVYSIDFSSNGQFLASASEDKTIKIWKVEGNSLALFKSLPPIDEVTSVSFSPNNKVIASGTFDGKIRLWNFDATPVYEKDECKSREAHEKPITAVRFISDDSFVTADEDGIIKQWQVKGCKFVMTFKERHQSPIRSIDIATIAPYGETLISGDANGVIRLWQLNDRSDSVYKQGEPVYSVNFSHDGKLVATAGFGGIIKLWTLNLEKRKLDKNFDIPLKSKKSMLSAEFSPLNSKLLAASTADGKIKLWDIGGSKEKELEPPSTPGNHQKITFSPNGIFLASASTSDDDPTINIWTINGLKFERVNQFFSKQDKKYDSNAALTNPGINAISFSPNSQTLASASEDHTISLWQVSNGQRRFLKGHNAGVLSITFSPDGQILASVSHDKTIKLWRVSDGKEIWSQLGGTSQVNSVDFSSDRKTLASGNVDGTLDLWDVKDKVFLYKLQGHKNSIRSVHFSPDSQILISGSDDESIRLWDLNLDSLIKKGCDRIRNYLNTNPNVQKNDKHICD